LLLWIEYKAFGAVRSVEASVQAPVGDRQEFLAISASFELFETVFDASKPESTL
jgi:hypothetical protein